jgi:GxxExxY protein
MENDPQTYDIIGAAMGGPSRARRWFSGGGLSGSLGDRICAARIPFRAEVELPVEYKGMRLSCGYRADFVCFENVLVEIKATAALVSPNQAQLLNQLKATKHR